MRSHSSIVILIESGNFNIKSQESKGVNVACKCYKDDSRTRIYLIRFKGGGQ